MLKTGDKFYCKARSGHIIECTVIRNHDGLAFTKYGFVEMRATDANGRYDGIDLTTGKRYEDGYICSHIFEPLSKGKDVAFDGCEFSLTNKFRLTCNQQQTT